ncbi:TPA: hypothetical protein KZS43_004762 [Escherichia coli]|nr:hypothetical protein [Escherichia coli]HBI2748960.1 hypothetical protein [Escherichia coli]
MMVEEVLQGIPQFHSGLNQNQYLCLIYRWRNITCLVGSTTIATFNTVTDSVDKEDVIEKTAFRLEDAQELANNQAKIENAMMLITSSDSCPADESQVCLEFSSAIARARFEKLYTQIDLPKAEFSKLINEEVINNASTYNAPSTHTTTVIPITSSGAAPDLNAKLISADAEKLYQYEPKTLIRTEGQLIDRDAMAFQVLVITVILVMV